MNKVDYTLWSHLVGLSNHKNSNPQNPEEPINQVGKIYGVRINPVEIDVNTQVVYTDDAVGFTPAKMKTTGFDYGTWANRFPFNKIKPCLLKNREVKYYLDPNDFTKKEDGTPSDITSGIDGDVMIEIPKVYWKITSGVENNRVYYDVKYSDVQIDSTYQALAHQKSVGQSNNIYIGAYATSATSDTYRSLSGATIENSIKLSTVRDKYANKGTGWSSIGIYQLTLLQVLYTIMFKDLNSRRALGEGRTKNLNALHSVTGVADNEGMFYGSTSNEESVKIFGIEDLWGNYSVLIDGTYVSTDNYIKIAVDNFSADNQYVTYTNIASQINSSGTIGGIQGTTAMGFIPTTVSESLIDGYFYDNSRYTRNNYGLLSGYGNNRGIFNLYYGMTVGVVRTNTCTIMMFRPD